MKTLTVILHHNTTKYTDDLYELLAPDQKEGNYDLVVVDNGSDPDKGSQYTTYKLEDNVFFGGGLNAAMELVLENTEYDSLLFLNNDLIVGKNFVKSLRFIGRPDCYDVVSPCIIQPEKTQNHWSQMLPWGYWVRSVKWVDLQAPWISRRLIEHLNGIKTSENIIDPLLIRGWGIDVYLGIICEINGWKTGVCDQIPAVHLGSMTMKALNNVNDYCRLAEQGMGEFFYSKGLLNKFNEMRFWAETYNCNEVRKEAYES